MQPSSLIFLVILGIWAAFFLQYWMRRREMIATARSIDTFSATMRVLQTSQSTAHLDLEAPRPNVETEAPARSLRSQILVKRADPPALAMLIDDAAASGSGKGPAMPPSTSSAMSPARSLRGLTLLVGLVGTLAYLGLVLAGVLLPVALVAPVVITLAGFLWLRSGVQGEIAARHPARPESARPARTHSAGPSSAEATRADVPVTLEDAAEHSPVSPAGELAPASPGAEPFDLQAWAVPGARSGERKPRPAAVLGAVEVDEDDMPITWQPRQVPPPLYTQKARVERRPAAPAPQGEPGVEHTASGMAAMETFGGRRAVNG